MPLYEYYCETCKREVTVPMSVSEHDKGERQLSPVPRARRPPAPGHLLLEDVAQVLISSPRDRSG